MCVCVSGAEWGESSFLLREEKEKDTLLFWYVCSRSGQSLKEAENVPILCVSVLGQVNSADRFSYLPKNSNIFILKNWLRKRASEKAKMCCYSKAEVHLQY